VVNSPPSRTLVGFEQYGQCNGHRYVISASNAYGRGAIM
jgi:hypothetical protein